MKGAGILQTTAELPQNKAKAEKLSSLSLLSGQCQAKAVFYLREVLTRRLEISWEAMLGKILHISGKKA